MFVLVLLVAGFIIGTILGSLAKALADRSLKGKTFWGRSKCDFCKKTLGFLDLIPIISYILSSGKCRYCKKKLGLEYPLIEVMLGILTCFVFWQSFQTAGIPADLYDLSFFIYSVVFELFFIAVLSSLFLTDMKEMLIPDRIIIPSILIGFLLLLIGSGLKLYYLYSALSQNSIGQHLLPPESSYFYTHAVLLLLPLVSGILCALVIGGFFYLLILITQGRGMGGGDVKLGFFIGLMLGFPNSLIAIFLSFLIGAIFSIFLLIKGKKKFGQVIPFGPFLVLGSLIALFWGNQLLDLYLKLGT